MTFARNNRPVFVAAALLCYAAAIVLAPSGARSQFDPRTRPADVTETRIEPPPHPIAPERDAFAPRATIDDEPVLPTPPPLLRRLPAPRAPAVAATALPSHVAAIVTGSHPTAIVDSATGSRLVSVGDPLDGSLVVEITNDTVGLANGKHLTLEAEETP